VIQSPAVPVFSLGLDLWTETRVDPSDPRRVGFDLAQVSVLGTVKRSQGMSLPPLCSVTVAVLTFDRLPILGFPYWSLSPLISGLFPVSRVVFLEVFLLLLYFLIDDHRPNRLSTLQ